LKFSEWCLTHVGMDKTLMKGPGITHAKRRLQHQPIWRYFT